MKTLSKQAEKEILATIENVCDMVNDGSDPTDAVTKVANDRSLSPNFIRLVCAGYNTGATNYQREKEAGVLDKLAEFPLADADAVVAKLYPKDGILPLEQKSASAVSEDYSRAPRPSVVQAYQRIQKVASYDLKKLAGADQSETVERQIPVEDQMKHAYCKSLDEKRALDQSRWEYSVSQDKLLSLMGQLGDYFRKSASDWTFPEVAYAVESRYGTPGRHLMNYVRTRNNVKQAEALVPTRAVDWDAEPFKLATDCLDAARESQKLKHAYQAKQSLTYEKVGGLLRPFGPEQPEPEKPILVGETQEKQAVGFLTGLLAVPAMRSLGDVAVKNTDSPSELVDTQVSELSDPLHENELRGIQARAMLQDFMSNDEVIAGYDPDEVLTAYNEISQLSPRSATQAAVIRPLLRKRLTAGGIEPFEAAELANVEKTLGQATAPDRTDKVSNVVRRTILD